MKLVKIPVKCPGCKDDLVIEANLFTNEFKLVLKAKPAGFGMKLEVVAHYKKVKGLDKVSTWDGSYRGRAIKAATKILYVFRKLVDPVSVAIELINDTEETARNKAWADWNLDSCGSRAGQWLADKQKGPRRQR